jgi:PEP-CTERM motif-containing protein
MKKRSLNILAAVFGFFLLNSNATAGYLDTGWNNITKFDGYINESSSNDWWNTTNEDQEVEPGAASGQEWDLEGFYLSDGTGGVEADSLAMVGGFDFAGGESWVDSGDIFIDTDMGTNYYDYVMDLNFQTSGSYTYTVYKNDGSLQYNVTHGGPSGPTQGKAWTFSNQGTATIVQGYDNIAMNYLSNKSDSEMGGGVTGGTHNAVVVDVSFLGPNTNFSLHNAIECGNDFTSGSGTTAAVPEPATIFLLGSGLLGLFGFRKKIRKSNS